MKLGSPGVNNVWLVWGCYEKNIVTVRAYGQIKEGIQPFGDAVLMEWEKGGWLEHRNAVSCLFPSQNIRILLQLWFLVGCSISV